MRKALFTVLLLSFPFLCLRAQQVVANQNGKCGYMDANGNMLVPYKYDFISDFADNGTAIVKKGSKFGMIDTTGTEILPLKYTEIGNETNGLRIVKNKDKQGLITADGKLLHKPQYAFIYPFNSQGIAKVVVKKGKKAKMLDFNNTYALLSNTGKEIYRGKGYQLHLLDYNQPYQSIYEIESDTLNLSSGYFCNLKTDVFYNLQGEQVLNKNIRESLYKQLFGNSASQKKAAKWVTNKEITPFSNDIAALYYSQQTDKEHAVEAAAYFDLKNQRLLWNAKSTYHKVWDKKDRKWTGEKDSIKVSLLNFSDGFGIVSVTGHIDAGNCDILVNKEGKEVGRYKVKSCYPYKFGYMVKADDKTGLYGVLDTTQQEVIPFEYWQCKTAVNKYGMWACKHKDNKWGMVTVDGKEIIPFLYDNIVQWPFEELMYVRKNGKWGAYERDSMILDCLYDSLYSYMDNSFVYKYGDLYGVYSLTTHALSDAHDGYEGCYIADSAYHDSQMREFYILDSKGVKFYGYLDGFGQKVIPFMFTDRGLAYEAYRLYRDKPTREFSSIDRYRLRLYLSRRSRTYTLEQTVPAADWDY